MPNTRGRPTSLDQPYDERRTNADRIIELMATGASAEACAGSVGINRSTLHDWLKIGARTRTAIHAGKLSHPNDPDGEQPLPDTHSLRCMQFSNDVEKARTEWLIRQEALLEAAGRPSERTIETVQLDPAGNELARTRKTERVAPDMATVRWRLERHPISRDAYGARQAIELSGPQGEAIPVEVRAGSLADKIAELRDKRAEQDPPDNEPDSP
jgi:hypothetical protein